MKKFQLAIATATLFALIVAAPAPSVAAKNSKTSR